MLSQLKIFSFGSDKIFHEPNIDTILNYFWCVMGIESTLRNQVKYAMPIANRTMIQFQKHFGS